MTPSALRAVAGRHPRDAAWVLGGTALLVACAIVATGSAAFQQVWILLVLAPLFEEAIFRIGVQEWLMRMTGRHLPALLGTALLFALLHAATASDLKRLSVVVPAVAIGVVYARTHRLRYCVALHVAMNALWLASAAAW